MAFVFKNHMLNRNIGNRLKKLIIHNRYTIKYVAEYFKVNRITIHNYENGKTSLSIKQVLDFCLLYDVTVNYLLFGNDEIFKPVDDRALWKL